MKTLLITFTAALVAASLIILAPSFASAAEPRVEDVVFDYQDEMKLSFAVKDAFNEDIEEAIKSGIPTSFTFVVKLNRSRGLWLDENIGTWRFNHTVKYDSLKQEYEVRLEESNTTEKTKDFAEMKSLMSEGTKIDISPVPALEQGYTYDLKVKAELDTVHLPFYLDYLVFFVKLWDFETDWYTYSFTR